MRRARNEPEERPVTAPEEQPTTAPDELLRIEGLRKTFPGVVAKAGKSVSVVGFDGTPDGLKAVEAGTLYASVAQQPAELGKIAVQNAVKAAKDEKVASTVKVPVKVVTRENVADFS